MIDTRPLSTLSPCSSSLLAGPRRLRYDRAVQACRWPRNGHLSSLPVAEPRLREVARRARTAPLHLPAHWPPIRHRRRTHRRQRFQPATILVVGARAQVTVTSLLPDAVRARSPRPWRRSSYLLESVERGERHLLVICGGDDLGALLRRIWVRRAPWRALLPWRATCCPTPAPSCGWTASTWCAAPLFSIRGLSDLSTAKRTGSIEGSDEYAALVTAGGQAAHQPDQDLDTDLERPAGRRPTRDGTVSWATMPIGGTMGAPLPVGDLAFGAERLYPSPRLCSDAWARPGAESIPRRLPPPMRSRCTTASDGSSASATAWRSGLGVQAAVMCWNPVTSWNELPPAFLERLRARTGKGPDDAAETIYEGRFRWLQKNFPLAWIAFMPEDNISHIEVRAPTSRPSAASH